MLRARPVMRRAQRCFGRLISRMQANNGSEAQVGCDRFFRRKWSRKIRHSPTSRWQLVATSSRGIKNKHRPGLEESRCNHRLIFVLSLPPPCFLLHQARLQLATQVWAPARPSLSWLPRASCAPTSSRPIQSRPGLSRAIAVFPSHRISFHPRTSPNGGHQHGSRHQPKDQRPSCSTWTWSRPKRRHWSSRLVETSRTRSSWRIDTRRRCSRRAASA